MMTTRFRPFLTVDPTIGRPAPVARRLPMDVERSDEAVTLRVDVPGVRPEDVNVSVTGKVLRLEVTRDAGEPAGSRTSQERWFGTARRELQLSDSLDGAAVSASLDAGVLSLEIPVREAAKEQRIEVTVGSPAALPESAEESDAN